MASFALPPGFTTTPPASPSGGGAQGFALPPGFSMTPPAKAPAAPSGPDWGGMANQAIASVPLLGPAYLGGKAILDTLNNAPPPGPNERRGNLAPVIRDEQTGALRPAWPQLAVDAASAFTLPGDVASGKAPMNLGVPYSQMDPSTLDRAATLAQMVGTAPSMADSGMVPTSTRDLVTASGAKLPNLVADDLAKSGIAPQDVNKTISDLGPGAVLADTSPLLQGRAAKLATLPEQAQQTVADTLAARQAAAAARVKAGLGAIVGPDPVPSQVEASINAARQAANKGYEPVFTEKALSPDFAYDAQPIADAIDQQIPNFVGGTRAKVQEVRNMLVNPATGQLTQDPQTVMAVRHEIDGMINGMNGPGANSTTKGALTDLRKMMDGDLAMQVPGLKAVDAQHAEVASQKEAFDLGRTVLDGGKNAVHPDDLSAALDALRGPQGTMIGPRVTEPQGPLRLSQGTVSDMYRIVGTNANDRLSLKKIITGEGKWNYEKLATIFGQDKADQLLKLFQNEATMAQTENLALAGSKTARMAAGGAGMEANPNTANFLKNSLNLRFGDVAQSALDKLTGGLSAAQRATRNQAIADALMSGPTFGQSAVRGMPTFNPLVPATTGLINENVSSWRKALGYNN